jgi:hypothetical protein
MNANLRVGILREAYSIMSSAEAAATLAPLL